MKVSISGRRLAVTDVVRGYINKKVSRLSRCFDNITKVEVILAPEKGSYSAEMIVSAPRGNTFVGHAVDKDIYGALDLVIDKMERQVTRFKSKLRERKDKTTRRKFIPMSEERQEKHPLRSDSLSDLWW
jgi:putative sigma-54 modulation protein